MCQVRTPALRRACNPSFRDAGFGCTGAQGGRQLGVAAKLPPVATLPGPLRASLLAAPEPPALRPRRLGCQEAHPLVWTATGKLVGARGTLRLPPLWCQSVLPRPPGTRGFGSGLLRALWRRDSAAQTPAAAYSAAVSVCQHRSCHEPLTRASHHSGSLSAFEKECVDKYDIRIDAQEAAASLEPISRSTRHPADEPLTATSGLQCV